MQCKKCHTVFYIWSFCPIGYSCCDVSVLHLVCKITMFTVCIISAEMVSACFTKMLVRTSQCAQCTITQNVCEVQVMLIVKPSSGHRQKHRSLVQTCHRLDVRKFLLYCNRVGFALTMKTDTDVWKLEIPVGKINEFLVVALFYSSIYSTNKTTV